MDDRNISDAIADAILRMDYPDVRRGDGRLRLPEQPRKRVHRRTPQPPDLVLPVGLTWLEQCGRISARVSVGKDVIHVGYCAHDAAAIAALAERRTRAKALALSGATAAEIRAALREG